MSNLFQFAYFQNAFLIILILSILYPILSFFTVTKRLTFMGAGVAHTAFGGVAIGIFFDINPVLSALVFAIFCALAIGHLVRIGNTSYDTGIGIFFSFSMALGALLISLKKAYTFDLQGYLFGNILAVTRTDLILALTVLVLFLIFLYVLFHRLLFISFDPVVASVSGVSEVLLENLLLMFMAAIIVVSIKMIGIVLVSALIVLPGSLGLLLSKGYKQVIIIGIIYTIIISLSGLFLSNLFDLPPGALIVTLGTFLYFAILFWVKRTVRN